MVALSHGIAAQLKAHSGGNATSRRAVGTTAFHRSRLPWHGSCTASPPVGLHGQRLDRIEEGLPARIEAELVAARRVLGG